MARAQRRAGVILCAVSLLAAAGLWASPAAQAAVCQNVPGSTPGLDVSVGGQPQRVPGVSGVSVCVDTGAVPLVTATFDGRGNCTWSCFSVIVPGGSSSLPTVTLSYRLDGVLQTRTIGGGTVPGGGEACLLSVGGPDAPYPTCPPGVALGIDEDPTAGVLEDVQQNVSNVEQTVTDALGDVSGTVDFYVAYASNLANDTAEDAGRTIDNYEGRVEDALEDTVLPAVDDATETVCGEIPSMWGTDGYNWWEVEFCDDPVGWAALAPEAPCNTILPWQWDPQSNQYVSPCNDVVRWAELFLADGGQICVAPRTCVDPADVAALVCGGPINLAEFEDVEVYDCL